MTVESRSGHRVTDEELQVLTSAANSARKNSLVRRINSVSEKVATITGTEANHVHLLRFSGIIAGVIGATFLAGQIPDHQIGEIVSDAIGATGGALAGDNFRFVSSFGETKPKKFIKRIQNGEEIKEKDLVKFFKKFDDFLTEDQIREQLLGRKCVLDARALLIEEMSKRFRQKNGGKKPKTKEERSSERTFITDEIFSAQQQAQEQRAVPRNITKEGVRRAADALSGVVLIGGLAVLFNSLAHETQGGFFGIADDLVMFLAFAISALAKEEDKKVATSNNSSFSEQLNTENNNHQTPSRLNFGRYHLNNIPRINIRR